MARKTAHPLEATAAASASWDEMWPLVKRAHDWLKEHTSPIGEEESQAVLAAFSAYAADAGLRSLTHQQLADTLRAYWWEQYGLLPGSGIGEVLARPTCPPPEWLLEACGLGSAPATAAGAAVVEALTPPAIPSAFLGGLASVPSCVPMQGIMAALHNAPAWPPLADGRPAYSHKPRKGVGEVVTFMHPPHLVPPADFVELPQETIDLLWQQTRALSDLDADVLLACLAQAMSQREPDGTTWITATRVLEYRGLVPVTKREGGRRRRAGHRTEDLAEIAACMARLDCLWVEVQAVTVLEERAGKRPRRKTYSHRSKVLALTDYIAQRALAGHDLPLAWRFRPGTWLQPFLAPPNRQTALLVQRVLHYDPYRKSWEKRLGRYFTLHVRAHAAHPAPLTRVIGPLLDELHLPLDHRNPERTKRRFEAALQSLCADGVLGSWTYALEDALPARAWLDDWLRWDVIVTAPAAVAEHYAGLRQMPVPRR